MFSEVNEHAETEGHSRSMNVTNKQNMAEEPHQATMERRRQRKKYFRKVKKPILKKAKATYSKGIVGVMAAWNLRRI